VTSSADSYLTSSADSYVTSSADYCLCGLPNWWTVAEKAHGPAANDRPPVSVGRECLSFATSSCKRQRTVYSGPPLRVGTRRGSG
jgi:hypothetical protein